MDELYDNLENYNEENTIAELQAENKELKSKLEEYASTLDKLQKDFDKLTSEYKRLELNYSSLLKTAKAEIERKTQIIANLNLEKDKMVLKSFQNKSLAFNRSSGYDKPTSAHNCKEDRSIKPERGSKIKETGCSKHSSSKVATTERNYEDYNNTPVETTTNQEDIKHRLINLSNSSSRHFDPRMKDSNVKENIIQSKDENDSLKSRAQIRNRRKSMPAVSLEVDTFDINDKDLVSADGSRAHSREKSDNYCDGKDSTSTHTSREPPKENTERMYVDHYSDRRSSRFSEASSLEDRNSRCQEPDAHKSRHSRFDSEKTDRFRARDKSSHRHKKQSPDRYTRRFKDSHEKFYHRSEYDCPPKNQNHWRPNRERNRNSYENHHPYENEKVSYKNHDKYPMKHKIQHDYDDSDSKRMRIESHYKQHEEERRLQEEKEFLDKKFLVEPMDAQFSTCESPDFNHPDVSTHQIREIKLTATTKLDDPRLSNKKYVLKQNNGKATLLTAESENVDILPISKIAWGIKNIDMPKALVRRPSLEIEQSTKNLQMEIENPLLNISMESGEIYDSECLGSQDVPKEIVNKSKLPETTTKTSIMNLHDTKDVENTSQKNSSYKIPKLKKVVDDQQNRKKIKEIATLDILVDGNTPNYKRKISQNTIRDNDVSKQPVKENSLPSENKQGNTFIQSGNKLPNQKVSNDQKYLTAKDVVEGDLELSDDNCDINEQPANVEEDSIATTQLENKQKDEDQGFKIDLKKHSSDVLEKVTEPCKNKSTDPSKKTKNKKKPKSKDTKDECKNNDLSQLTEIDTRKKNKVLQTKTEQIKTKFSELFDDSSSLISPEDLGLPAVPASTMQMPGKCVQFFEDALDAADVNAIGSIKDLIPSEVLNEENRRDIDNTNTTKTCIESTISQDTVVKIYENQPEIVKDVYKNLEPGIAKTEETVKTVIISTGVQPQIVKNYNQGHVGKPEQQSVASREVALKALATSTPYKNGQSDVVRTDIEAIPDSSCTSNDSRMPNVENNTALHNSDSNTLEPQTNGDIPDVRIFVRRKRKIIKK